MAGDRDNTEAGLRTVFEQDYPDFEVVLGAASPDDAAVPIALRLMAEYPARASRLIFTGESPYPNRKVWQLRALLDEARYATFVMADSDIRWAPDCLKTVISELSQEGVGLVTCPYRASAGASIWSRMEALGLNVDFISGMLTARMLNGMDYAIGCTIATRRADLEAIGGLEEVQRHLSEDFVIGNRMHGSGRTVILSRSVIEHYIGDDSMRQNWSHRLRWARGSRRSRPLGYIGEIFTKPTVPALASGYPGAELGSAGGAGVGFAAGPCMDRGGEGSERSGNLAAVMALARRGRLHVYHVGAGILWKQANLARSPVGDCPRRVDTDAAAAGATFSGRRSERGRSGIGRRRCHSRQFQRSGLRDLC